jgi:hypothetical protein
MSRAARTVCDPSRDSFAAEFAGVLEYNLAVALVMIIERDGQAGTANGLGQRSLALLDRQPAEDSKLS